MKLSTLSGFLFLLIICSCKRNGIEIQSNERGVIFKTFGGGIDTSKVYMPGKYFISDYERIDIYNIDSKSIEEEFIFVSEDQIEMKLTIEHVSKPIPEKIALLHKYTGEGYRDFVVSRKIESIVKEYFQKYQAKDILLLEKKEYENELFRKSKELISKKYVDLLSLEIKKEISIE